LLADKPDPAALAAAFPKGTWLRIYDYGVGDQVQWPSIAAFATPE
ncbi:MAG: hypothetical protein HN904_11180, partial [Victivallales bacterium]|nr:hypothetical protein [Victivallales bacterium]